MCSGIRLLLLLLAGLLGHSAGSITSRYVHLDAALVAAADNLSDVIASALMRPAINVTRTSMGTALADADKAAL
jgi:predicted hydrolase (HD superfamily)